MQYCLSIFYLFGQKRLHIWFELPSFTRINGYTGWDFTMWPVTVLKGVRINRLANKKCMGVSPRKKSGRNNEVTVRQGFVVILIKTANFKPTVF